MTFIERRRPRRFRILYIPLGQAWKRFVLGKRPVLKLEPGAPPEPAAKGPEPMHNLLLNGPETLRRQGSRRP